MKHYRNKCIELGLAMRRSMMEPGEIATFQSMVDCINAVAEVLYKKTNIITRERMRQIEARALRKCRHYYQRNTVLKEELEEVFKR